MSDLGEIRSYLKPQDADERLRYSDGLDLEEIFGPKPARPEPRWLLWCRMRQDAIVFWCVAGIGLAVLVGLGLWSQ